MASSSGETAIRNYVASNSTSLTNISQAIWENPEEMFQEYRSSKLLRDFLQKEGFQVKQLEGRLETAFTATYGSGKPKIAIICEYDALPGIGHACGHNLIAEAGLLAGCALKAAVDALSLPGTVYVIGTPAEEGGGGKPLMIDQGCFNGVDVAMMVHPANISDAFPSQYLAVCHLTVTFRGCSLHTCKNGCLNAMDAAVHAYSSIAVLRQQFKPSWRVQGVISKGGTSVGLCVSETELSYYVRAPTVEELLALKGKVVACFQSAASANNCELNIKESSPMYKNLITNSVMARRFAEHVCRLGVDFPLEPMNCLCGSTDMGNVSHIVPSIHPKYKICEHSNHKAAFAVASNTVEAHMVTQTVAQGLALLAFDCMQNSTFLSEIKCEFEQTLSRI